MTKKKEEIVEVVEEIVQDPREKIPVHNPDIPNSNTTMSRRSLAAASKRGWVEGHGEEQAPPADEGSQDVELPMELGEPATDTPKE